MSVQNAKKFHKNLKVGKMEEPESHNKLTIWYPNRTVALIVRPGNQWDETAGKVIDFSEVNMGESVVIFTERAVVRLAHIPFQVEIYPLRD